MRGAARRNERTAPKDDRDRQCRKTGARSRPRRRNAGKRSEGAKENMIVHRFAEGVMKGRRLDSVGTFSIVKYRGDDVAQFRNGAVARFVMSEEADPPAIVKNDVAIPYIEEKPKEPETLHFSPALARKLVQNRLRFCGQRDTWDILPALAIVLCDGWSLELTWLNWCVCFDVVKRVKGQSLGNAHRQ